MIDDDELWNDLLKKEAADLSVQLEALPFGTSDN